MKRHNPEERQASRSEAAGRTMDVEPCENLTPPGQGEISADRRSAGWSELTDPEFLPDGEIALRAYGIWSESGYSEGTDREDWFKAERQLR